MQENTTLITYPFCQDATKVAFFAVRNQAYIHGINSDTGVISETFRDNGYSLDTTMLQGKIVVDLGANIGDFSILAALLGAKRVYAYEPGKDAFAMLKENVGLNRYTRTIYSCQKAVGKVRGLSGLTPAFAASALSDTAKEVVEVVTFRDVFKQNSLDHIDYLKIDIEGSEQWLVQKEYNDLWATVGHIGIELHSEYYGDPELRRILEHLGQFFSLNRSHNVWTGAKK